MPPRKRKVVEEESSVDGGSSGLSSPLSQGDLDLESEEQQRPAAVKKRKVDAVAGKVDSAKRGKAVKKEIKEEEEEEVKPAPKRQPRKKAAVKEEADGDKTVAAAAKPATKKRKTKEEKEAEAMPLAARTIGHKLLIGAHVSSAGGQYFFSVYSCIRVSVSSGIPTSLHQS